MKLSQRLTKATAQRSRWVISMASATILLAAAMGDASAQSESERIEQLERKLDQSLKMIDELAAKIRKLEEGDAAHGPIPSATTQSDRPAAVQNAESVAGDQPATNTATIAIPGGLAAGTPLRGFADVGAGWASQSTRRGVALGSMDFYFTPELGDSVRALIELVFEFDETGTLTTDLERLQFGYAFNDLATVWMGRFHTPYGYWNEAFHHGQQISTSLRRPRFLDFEDKGGILPAHTVGIWTKGRLSIGAGRLAYDVYAGNSPSIVKNELNPNNIGSTNHSAIVGLNLGYLLSGTLEGLKLGVHGFSSDVRDDAAPANTTMLKAWGGYFVYDTDEWEHIGEYYRFNNKDLSGGSGTHDSWAGFLQAGMKLGRWTPYGRLERAVLDQTDNYFREQLSGRSYARQALGLNYELSPKAALKLELSQTRFDDSPDANEARFQYAIRF